MQFEGAGVHVSVVCSNFAAIEALASSNVAAVFLSSDDEYIPAAFASTFIKSMYPEVKTVLIRGDSEFESGGMVCTDSAVGDDLVDMNAVLQMPFSDQSLVDVLAAVLEEAVELFKEAQREALAITEGQHSQLLRGSQRKRQDEDADAAADKQVAKRARMEAPAAAGDIKQPQPLPPTAAPVQLYLSALKAAMATTAARGGGSTNAAIGRAQGFLDVMKKFGFVNTLPVHLFASPSARLLPAPPCQTPPPPPHQLQLSQQGTAVSQVLLPAPAKASPVTLPVSSSPAPPQQPNPFSQQQVQVLPQSAYVSPNNTHEQATSAATHTGAHMLTAPSPVQPLYGFPAPNGFASVLNNDLMNTGLGVGFLKMSHINELTYSRQTVA
ncbi:hypothetical protein JKP88DRAFT_316741 [Tribonema minus]|uniref:Uncharacterized protein n=1 Tax=Tribonema minus TaxID=303371 RepID=A0A835Z205_9STRA|nr:hypothetical protein JKP88DRAFT_316741 [Tribonema minus]